VNTYRRIELFRVQAVFLSVWFVLIFFGERGFWLSIVNYAGKRKIFLNVLFVEEKKTGDDRHPRFYYFLLSVNIDNTIFLISPS